MGTILKDIGQEHFSWEEPWCACPLGTGKPRVSHSPAFCLAYEELPRSLAEERPRLSSAPMSAWTQSLWLSLSWMRRVNMLPHCSMLCIGWGSCGTDPPQGFITFQSPQWTLVHVRVHVSVCVCKGSSCPGGKTDGRLEGFHKGPVTQTASSKGVKCSSMTWGEGDNSSRASGCGPGCGFLKRVYVQHLHTCAPTH